MRLRTALCVLLVATGCGRGYTRETDRYTRQQLSADLEDATIDPGLVIGEFSLTEGAVVDGDTVKVGGLDASLRLLGIDSEETFKSEKDLRLYENGFEQYLAKKKGDSVKPVKCATPVGMEAKAWAEKFFQGVLRVRLERDHPKELKGRFNRYLTYVFVERDGTWVNYNIEHVRAGMSPYFTKYGYSRRFHDEFVEAQQQARAAKRGIWDPAKEHYPDYDVRLKWWNARAEFIKRFEAAAKKRDDHIVLTHWDALDRLADLVGKEVVLLGAVGTIRERKGKAPGRVLLSRRMFADFPLIFFDDAVFEQSGIEQAKGEFVSVRGTVTKYVYKNRRRRGRKEPRQELQIVVRHARQIGSKNFVFSAQTAPVQGAVSESKPPPPAAEPPPAEAATPGELSAEPDKPPPAPPPDSPEAAPPP